jgi:hypothetical protein
MANLIHHPPGLFNIPFQVEYGIENLVAHTVFTTAKRKGTCKCLF